AEGGGFPSLTAVSATGAISFVVVTTAESLAVSLSVLILTELTAIVLVTAPPLVVGGITSPARAGARATIPTFIRTPFVVSPSIVGHVVAPNYAGAACSSLRRNDRSEAEFRN